MNAERYDAKVAALLIESAHPRTTQPTWGDLIAERGRADRAFAELDQCRRSYEVAILIIIGLLLGMLVMAVKLWQVSQ